MRKMQPYRPLGTLYAAAALRDAGYSVALFDTMLSDPESGFRKSLAHYNPKLVVIYEDDFNFLTKMCLTRMREVAWRLTDAAREKGIPVIAHGSDATDHSELFLSHGISYVLRGEAEQTLVALCTYLITGREPLDVDGLVRIGETGETTYAERALSKNPDWVTLDQTPNDLTDFSSYRHAWKKAHGYFSVNMVSSRGCPYHCNWCAKPISGNKFQLRAATAVAEEMRQLKQEAGVDHIWFSDDVFALNRHWVQEFASEVSQRKAAVPFKIQSRADLMTEETAAALKLAGCAEVWMGVESGSQKILDAMDKGLKISTVQTARQTLKKFGIRAGYFLQFGYPGERWPDLQETIEFVRDTRPDDIGISFSYPLPGTVFYEQVQTQLGSKRNWADSDDLCIMFQAEYTSEFYRAVRDVLHAEVDAWAHGGQDFEMAQASVERLWNEVSLLEPISRNPDALKLSATNISHKARTDIFPIHQLTGATEA
jgi:anaerobic magnesium-protoporphyrin IX monomethyl ester cyclase